MPGKDGSTDLDRLLDVLIPSFEGLPGAGSLGLAGSVASDALANPRFAAALQRVLDALGSSTKPFGESDVRTVEEHNPEAFADVINLAYTNYYTDARVLAVVERHTGYRAAPPQPTGYELAPFDPALLENVVRRAVSRSNQLTEPDTSP